MITERDGIPEREYLLLDFPLTDYLEIHGLQLDIVRAKQAGLCRDEVMIMVEHPPVFTLGRRGGLEKLPFSREYLEERGITVHQVERGGTITCHGPGQLVVYPILNLRRTGFRVPEYVSVLEEVMLRTAADFGVKARRRAINRGIFAGDNKLGSVGIAIRRGITFHGLALNINPVPEHFTYVEPCGLHGVAATSMARELGRELSMEKARAVLKKHIESAFGCRLIPGTLKGFRRDRLQPRRQDNVLRPDFPEESGPAPRENRL